MTMNTKTKRGIATGTSLALIGGLVVGAFSLTATMASTTEPAPRPASSVTEVREAVNPITPEDEAIAAKAREARRIEAERLAAEQAAREAAVKAEAERLAAEQAAADEAARQAAEQAYQAPATQTQAPANPAPAEPGGNQQAGECREYNDNNECTAYYVP